MPKYWLISDRNNGGTGTDRNVAGLTYFVSDTKPLSDINNWSRVTGVQFQRLLRTATDGFPALPPGQNENQSHVTILITVTMSALRVLPVSTRRFAAASTKATAALGFASSTIGHRLVSFWIMNLTVLMPASAPQI